MFTLKLNRTGDSVSAIFPKEMLSKIHIKEGDSLHVIETPEGYMLVPHDASYLQKKRFSLAKEIMRENRDVLKALSE